MEINKPVTIKDIARRFNCSPSTVSRALNDHTTINPDTRANIQEYAREVGYQRNEVSLSLLNKKTDTLGLIVPTISSYFEATVIEGLHSVLHPLGYTLTICVSNESWEIERDFINKLLSNRVEGIFLSIAQETYDRGYYQHLESVLQRYIPLIFIDRDFEGFAASRAIVNDYLGAYAAVEHLISRGCRRIAHLRGPEGLTVSEQRLAGYLDCLTRYGIQIKEELIIHTNFKVESAIIPTQRLLNLPERPDAIFAANDQIAIGAMRVIIDRHLRIPDDISIVGFDNSPISAYSYPSLTTVARPGVKIGMEASRMFRSQVSGTNPNIPESIILPSELIIRESSLRS